MLFINLLSFLSYYLLVSTNNNPVNIPLRNIMLYVVVQVCVERFMFLTYLLTLKNSYNKSKKPEAIEKVPSTDWQVRDAS